MSITLTIAIATGTAVAGFIFSRVLDTKYMDGIKDIYEENISLMKEDFRKKEEQYLEIIYRYQIKDAQAKLKSNSLKEAVKKLYETPLHVDESIKGFFDVTAPLPEPEDDWTELDFPNDKEE